MADSRCGATEVPFRGTTTRIDFFMTEAVMSKGFRAICDEIKVSRSDFLRDSAKKQDGALKYSDRFWYVTPPDLIDKSEVPEWAGLMEWNGRSFVVRKKAPPRQKKEPSWGVVIDIIRNSGQCRRDVQVLKDAAAMQKQRADNLQRQASTENRWATDRFIRKFKSRPLG